MYNSAECSKYNNGMYSRWSDDKGVITFPSVGPEMASHNCGSSSPSSVQRLL